MALDLLIEDARIVDGTGSPWFSGAVGIAGGQIERIFRQAKPSVSADEVRDAEGNVVCPGFIDLHSHADIEPFSDPTVAPKITQGVTTEIVGQDGFSMAPARSEELLEEWWTYLGGVYPAIDNVRSWNDIAEYLDALDEHGSALNVATLVGHGTVRANVLGMRDDEPTASELAEMADLVADALADGAVGFSTGLEYSPQCHASTEEVRELARQLEPFGLPFVAHIRSYGDDMWEALDEFIDIGAREGIPVHLSHFQVSGTKRGLADRAVELVNSARERDVDFTADMYPYDAGSGFLLALLPRRYHSLGEQGLRERLRDEKARKQLGRELECGAGPWDLDWSNVVVCNTNSEEFESVLGQDIETAANERDVEPHELVIDLLLEGDFKVGIINTVDDPKKAVSERDMRSLLTHDTVGIGSDGIFGEQPHPRTYATYPRILGHFVRETNVLSLEEAIRKMTSLPARIVGLQRKGIVRPDQDADIVVFNPRTVSNSSTVERPGRPTRGIVDVLVNGEFVVKEGAVTGRTPGEAIRSRSSRS